MCSRQVVDCVSDAINYRRSVVCCLSSCLSSHVSDQLQCLQNGEKSVLTSHNFAFSCRLHAATDIAVRSSYETQKYSLECQNKFAYEYF